MNQPQALLPGEPTRRRWRLLLVAPAVIGLALAAAACGGGSRTADVASLGTTTTASPAGATVNGSPSSNGERVREVVEFARCIRSHGVLNFPDPASPPGAARAFKESGAMSSPEFQAAARACAKYAPPTTPPPQITTHDQADYLKATACMRNHGVVGFPDPVFSRDQVEFPIPESMNTKSAQFLRAREICETLIPAGLPYSKEAEGGQ